MKSDLSRSNSQIIILATLFIAIFYNILNGGIFSDYNFAYSFEGVSFIKGYENFYTYVQDYVKYTFFEQKLIRLCIFIWILLGYFTSAIFIKLFHFILVIILFWQLYRFVNYFFSKNNSLFYLGFFLIFIQYSNYLDPLNSWPLHIISFLIILEFFIISFKIYENKKINLFYYFILNFLLLFFYELGVLFLSHIFLIFFLKKLNKDFSDNDQKFLIISILIFIFYIIFKFFIEYNSDVQGYSGGKLFFKFPESVKTYFYQFLRAFPLTTLFINQDFHAFIKILTNKKYYLILLISILFFFFVKKSIKIAVLNKKIFSTKFPLLIICVMQMLFLPPLLMALSQRYAMQISGHGLGHAHYVVMFQTIGASLLSFIILLKLFFIFDKKFINVLTLVLSVIFYINTVNNHQKTKIYFPEKNLYPYIYFENLTKILRENKNIKNIDIIILQDNDYKSYWESDYTFSKYLKKNIKVYGSYFLNQNKIEKLDNQNLDKHGIIYFKNLSFNKNFFYGEYCFFDKNIKKTLSIIKECKHQTSYEEKRLFGYFKLSSKLIKD